MEQSEIYGIVLETLREEGDLPVSKIIKLAKKLTGNLRIGECHHQATKIYALLTEEFQKTGEITFLAGMKSNEVSAILRTIEKETGLIEHQRDGKLKSWRRKV